MAMQLGWRAPLFGPPSSRTGWTAEAGMADAGCRSLREAAPGGRCKGWARSRMRLQIPAQKIRIAHGVAIRIVPEGVRPDYWKSTPMNEPQFMVMKGAFTVKGLV